MPLDASASRAMRTFATGALALGFLCAALASFFEVAFFAEWRHAYAVATPERPLQLRPAAGGFLDVADLFGHARLALLLLGGAGLLVVGAAGWRGREGRDALVCAQLLVLAAALATLAEAFGARSFRGGPSNGWDHAPVVLAAGAGLLMLVRASHAALAAVGAGVALLVARLLHAQQMSPYWLWETGVWPPNMLLAMWSTGAFLLIAVGLGLHGMGAWQRGSEPPSEAYASSGTL